jgi:hypothetical protein
MADGTLNPNYFDIDQSDGSIGFINRANNPIEEYFGIIISASDNYGNVDTYQTDYF